MSKNQKPIDVFKDKRYLFGQVAVDLGVLTPQQVQEVMQWQKGTGSNRNIGAICEEMGFINSNQLEAILKEQANRLKEAFAESPSGGVTWADGAEEVPKVLFVDDSATVRHFAKMALGSICQVTIAKSGTDAVQAIRDNLGGTPFDLILLDIEMPGMNGFDLSSAIRRIPVYRNVSILFVSMYNTPEYQEKVKEHGGLGLLAKPSCSSKEAFREMVKRHLKSLAGQEG